MSRAPKPRILADLGEQRLIERIRAWLGAANPRAPYGIGDDCAVLPAARLGWKQLVTVDPVIRGRHFDDALPPARVAQKLLRRNLSDIAAMGGTPRHAVVGLAAPPDLPVAWLQGFYRALGRDAQRFGVRVVGGDCAQSGEILGAWLTLLGDAPRRPLTRAGARPGDLVFVTGELGGSILGQHAKFSPRLEEGRWLASRAEVRAALDVSDGLAKDIRALIPPDCAVVLDPGSIPVSSDAIKFARRDGRPALEHACNDGEDYELLFALAPARIESFVIAWHRRFATRLSCIGRIVPARGAKAGTVTFHPAPAVDVRLGGYEHFC